MSVEIGARVSWRLACYVFSFAFAGLGLAQAKVEEPHDLVASPVTLRNRIEASPVLPLHRTRFTARPPFRGWKSGAVSGIAVDKTGNIYEIQRGAQADSILVLSHDGNLLRSWGHGKYQLPHSIRIDPSGNVWAVDAASSTVTKYSQSGQELLTITIGGQPSNGSSFNGTTDIAFGPSGRLFITDGYGNARVLEYTHDGKKLREWGHPGSGPGEFNLPHAIQIDNQEIIYVADRENGRIEKFDLQGKYLGEIARLGRVYSLKIVGNVLWASMGPLNQPPGSPGWIVKLDRRTGNILGHLDVTEASSGHSIEVTQNGEPIITAGKELIWFKAK